MTERPYDIQRGTIQKKYNPAADIYSRAVEDDYMGASEFEWGAKPRSLRRLQESAEALRQVKMEGIQSRDGKTLVAYGDFTSRHDPVEFERMMHDVVYGKARTREFTGFRAHVEEDATSWPLDTDFWWDIRNDVMMSFDAKFMDDLPRILKNSWAYMGMNS